jgi:hypothetical protein
MPDYGIKASQKGYDVKTCADYELLFSAGWPLLKIEKQGSFTVNDKTANVQITTHDLGYAPMFMIFSPEGVNGASTQSRFQTLPVMASATDLKWFGAYWSEPAGSVTLYYYIFRYPLTTNFTANTLHDEATSKVLVDDYGVKISKSGSDVDSTDMRDFVIHSSCRSLQVHKSFYKAETAGSWSETITHDLTYEPFFLFYLKDVYGYGDGATLNYWQMIDARAQEEYGYADTTSVYVGAIPKGDISVIIFKDPFSLEE